LGSCIHVGYDALVFLTHTLQKFFECHALLANPVATIGLDKRTLANLPTEGHDHTVRP
jgi:hypothetical protein